MRNEERILQVMTCALQIRCAARDDVEEVNALVLDAKALWHYPDEQMRAWRSALRVSAESIAAQPAFVGELGGSIVAFCSLLPSDREWELDNLWVVPRCVGQGFGRAMLNHAAQAAAKGGAVSIAIDADPNAEPFYLACGAKRRSVIPAPITGNRDRVRPQLVLRVS